MVIFQLAASLSFCFVASGCFPRNTGDEVIIPGNPFAQKTSSYQKAGWPSSAVAWAEGLLREHGHEEKLSSFYFQYRHMEFILLQTKRDRIDMSGDFASATDLMLRYGLMRDKDFLPQLSMIERQERVQLAVERINESLLKGTLKSKRGAKAVRLELNRAFEIDFNPLTAPILRPEKIQLGKLTMKAEIARARAIYLSERAAVKQQKEKLK